MRHEIIHMKEYYPVLGQEGRDPLLTTYLPYNMLEMGRQDQKRPCLLDRGVVRFSGNRLWERW